MGKVVETNAGFGGTAGIVQNKVGSIGALVKLPRSENVVFDQWLKVCFFSFLFLSPSVWMCPNLICEWPWFLNRCIVHNVHQQQDTGHVFLAMNGKPRQNIS